MRTIAMMVLVGGSLWAQGAGKNVYRVEYEITEAGTAQAPQRITLMIEDPGRGMIRTGSKIPVTVDTVSDKGTGRRTDYVDVGVNLDCRLRMEGGKALLWTSLELNSMKRPEPGSPGTVSTPVFQSLRATVDAGMKPGEKVTIARLDGGDGKRTVEVAVTTSLVN